MSIGLDVENLLKTLDLTSFPYVSFDQGEDKSDRSVPAERWIKSLEILRREWERAAALAEESGLTDAHPRQPEQASVEAPRMTAPNRAHQRLFSRETQRDRGGDTSLSNLFDRIS